MGFSRPDPLKVSEVLALCDLRGIAQPSERSKYLSIVQQLDQVFFNHLAESKA
jgi:hypothetical protein